MHQGILIPVTGDIRLVNLPKSCDPMGKTWKALINRDSTNEDYLKSICGTDDRWCYLYKDVCNDLSDRPKLPLNTLIQSSAGKYYGEVLMLIGHLADEVL